MMQMAEAFAKSRTVANTDKSYESSDIPRLRGV